MSTRTRYSAVLIAIFAFAALTWPAAAEAQRRGPWGPYGPYRYPRYVIDDFSASVKFDVEPKDAEVYVDGALAGEVDDFDGLFQSLRLRPGSHEIVVFKDGFRSVRETLYIEPYQSRKLKFDLEPLRPGDPAELRPTPPPPGSRQEPQRPDYPRDPPRPAPRAEPPADRTEVPAEFGTLSLRVQPGDTEVLIDGEKWAGAADDQRLNIRLAAGQHRIEVRKEGFVTYAETILIRRNATMNLNVSLTRVK